MSEQRGQLRNPDNASWFTIFAVCTSRRVFHSALAYIHLIYAVFEIVSAYGTVGLSLGIPSVESSSGFSSFAFPLLMALFCFKKNYSLAGAMSNASKLVLCAVMLRGRHSGLPVALDRAIVFPTEFARKESEKVAMEQLPLATVAPVANGLGEKLPPVKE